MVLRMLDEDDSVKDLAVKSVEELWFSNVNPTTSGVNGKSSMRSTPGQAQQDKAALTAKVMIIMGTAANFKDRQSPLEDVLHKIMADKQNSEAASLHGKYSEICELLIDGLVDDPDMAGAVCTVLCIGVVVNSRSSIGYHQHHSYHLLVHCCISCSPVWLSCESFANLFEASYDGKDYKRYEWLEHF